MRPAARKFTGRSKYCQAALVAWCLSRFLERVDSALNRHCNWFVAGLVIIFLGANWRHASNSPLWFDELAALYIARLPDFDRIWRALTEAANVDPPFSFLITKISAQALGWTPLAVRLPAMLGYLVMMLCMFCIVRRYTTPQYALIAMLASYLTRVPAYALEGRPYGLLLGFSSLALLFWMRATQGRNRLVSILIFCLSLAAALGSHYYAVLTFFGLAAGEAARIWARKRIDWLVLGAFALATTPLFLSLPLIRAAARMNQTGYAAPTLQALASGMADLVFPLNGILIISLSVLLIFLLRFARDGDPRPADTIPAPAVHEWVAWTALALAPVEALVLGKLVTGIILARYFIVFIIGFSVVLAVWLYRAFQRSAFASVAFLCLCLFWFAVRITVGSRRDNPSAQLSHLIQENNPAHLPVAVADGLRYLQLQYYAPQDVRSTLAFLIEPSAALQYSGISIADMNLTGLRGVAPINVPDYSDFVHSHKSFLMLWGESGWLPPKLNADRARIVFKGKAGVGALYTVEF